MNKRIIVGIVLIFAVLVGIAIIDAGAKRPIDWTKTYNFRDKIPYGLFVFREELPNILGKDKAYEDFGESMYEVVSALDSAQNYNNTVFEIDSYLDYDDTDTKYILQFVEGGGEVFFSAESFSDTFVDTLGIAVEKLDYSIFIPTDKRIKYSLVGDTSKILMDKMDGFYIFSKLNPETCTVLGYLHARGRAIPNFVQVKHGKGMIYLHAMPEIFGNYHILKKDGYEYVSRAISVIDKKNMLLADHYFRWEQPKTPLRVILSQPGLSQAWYVLLASLVLLLIFKTKREQRAVKIMHPEPNLSKEFAKTIGSLYYEKGNPGNIIHKKIEYFLYSIRTQFHLETIDLKDEKFIKQLSLKSTVDYKETKDLIFLLSAMKEKNDLTIADVKMINERIENFKSKANII